MASAVQDRDATTLRRTEAEIDSTSGFNFGARGEKKFVQVEADEGEEKKKLWLIENLENDKLFFIQLSFFSWREASDSIRSRLETGADYFSDRYPASL